MALTNKLTAIADAIREKTGTTDPMTLDAMPTAISGIETGSGSADLPEEAFNISGTASYRFFKGAWDWFIEQYGDKITTKNITSVISMFAGSKLTEIPFDINLSSNYTSGIGLSYMFDGSSISKPPYINGKIGSIDAIFNSCTFMVEIPNDWADKIDWSVLHDASGSKANALFIGCYSLKEIPTNLLKNLYSKATFSSYSPYYNNYKTCYVLEEIKEIGIQQGTITNNGFANTFQDISRVKSITFAVQEDGTPYTVNWKSQAITLSQRVGYATNTNVITNYADYHGITADKQVTDDVTYQALKDDPDWWTTDVNYSRYNHDSAVETINSLPDTSAYLATVTGTNTIEFIGASGEKTDGGAINTMTEEEIAVATAKGWTVTLA